MMPEFSPLGDCGVRISFGNEISPKINTCIRRFGAALATEPVEGVTEWVCGYAAAAVYYRPWLISYEELCGVLMRRLQRRTEAAALPARRIEIPVCYGGELGPDLEEVAARHGLTTMQVIQRHSRPSYLVYFLGFLPGFAYLGGLPPSLSTPRRATPRLQVPAGAVGIAGAQTGVYPVDTPGGWQIIGRTPFRLYEPQRDPPSLLAPGDRVRFVSVSRTRFDDLQIDNNLQKDNNAPS